MTPATDDGIAMGGSTRSLSHTILHSCPQTRVAKIITYKPYDYSATTWHKEIDWPFLAIRIKYYNDILPRYTLL